MISFQEDFTQLNLFDCSDLGDLISPDPGNRTITSLFLGLYDADDIFQHLEHYGLFFLSNSSSSSFVAL
jgi:hypothetical protein